MKYAFILVFLSFNGFSKTEEEMRKDLIADSKKSDYKIDWKYTAGSYLIYDCIRGSYACVNSAGYENCKEERAFSISKKADQYPCAPLEIFSNKKICLVKNYELLALNAPRRFCYPK